MSQSSLLIIMPVMREAWNYIIAYRLPEYFQLNNIIYNSTLDHFYEKPISIFQVPQYLYCGVF